MKKRTNDDTQSLPLLVLTLYGAAVSNVARGAENPPATRECVRPQRSESERQNSAQYSTASVATGCSHSTPALLSVSHNYIGFELNGGIGSLRSRYCTERFDHDQFEFSHSKS